MGLWDRLRVSTQGTGSLDVLAINQLRFELWEEAATEITADFVAVELVFLRSWI